MKITLTKFKFAAFASKETNCFEAVVCIDGKPAFHASNEGHGGCDRHRPLPGQDYEEMKKHIDAINAYGKTLPPRVFHGSTLTYDVELLVGEAVEREVSRRALTRKLKTHVLFTKPGSANVYQVKGQINLASRDAFVRKFQPDKILQDLPIDEALDLYLTA